MNVDQIAGSFVVEVGFRQAWPFLGLADNRPTVARETRLYIDSTWTINSTTSLTGEADDDVAWLTAAIAMNGETIDSARLDDNILRLTTTSGIQLLIANEQQPYTIGEPWHFSGWRDA